MKRTIAWVGVLLLCMGLVAVLWPRGPALSDEAKILNAILDVKRAVEAKDAGGVLRHISDDYSDGAHTKRDIVALVVEAFRSAEPFGVHVEAPQIRVEGDRATARIQAQFWTGADVAPQDRQQLDVLAEFAREGRQWKLIRATGWEAAGEQL